MISIGQAHLLKRANWNAFPSMKRKARSATDMGKARMYIAGGGKRRDSWAGVAIYRAAKKAISYQVKIDLNQLPCLLATGF